MEIKIITFVIELGVKSIVTLYNEGQVQVICNVIKCGGFFNSYLGGVNLFDIIPKLLIVENNQIVRDGFQAVMRLKKESQHHLQSPAIITVTFKKL